MKNLFITLALLVSLGAAMAASPKPTVFQNGIIVQGAAGARIDTGPVVGLDSGLTNAAGNRPWHSGDWGDGISLTNLITYSSNELGVLRPEWFGAVANNSTDCGTAFQKTVDVAQHILQTQGRLVRILLRPSPTNYYTTKSICFTNTVLFDGPGEAFARDVGGRSRYVTIRFAGAIPLFYQTNGLISGSRFKGIGIQGPGANVAGSYGYDLAGDRALYSGQNAIIEGGSIYNCEQAIRESGQDNLRVLGVTIDTCTNGFNLYAKAGKQVNQACYIFDIACYDCYGKQINLNPGAAWGGHFDIVSTDLFKSTNYDCSLYVGPSMTVTYSGNMEGSSPSHRIIVDGGSLELYPGLYDKGNTPATAAILLTNDAKLKVHQCTLAQDANGVSVVSWNTTAGSDYIISDVELKVTNAAVNKLFMAGPFNWWHGGGVALPQNAKNYPAAVFQFTFPFQDEFGNYHPSYDWVGHSLAVSGVKTNWSNWDEFNYNWNIRHAAPYSNTDLTISNLNVLGTATGNFPGGSGTNSELIGINGIEVRASGTNDATFHLSGNAPLSSTATNNAATQTNLNASALASGTVPDARLSANVPVMTAGVLPAVDGSQVTNLTGVSSGPWVSGYGWPILHDTISGAAWNNIFTNTYTLRDPSNSAAVFFSSDLGLGTYGFSMWIVDATGSPTNVDAVLSFVGGNFRTSGTIQSEGGFSSVSAGIGLGGSATAADFTAANAPGFIGDASGLTNLIGSVDSLTNAWTVNTAIGLGTNYVLSQGASTVGIIGVVNLPATTERYAQLSIVATGDIVFTNPAGIHASDFLSSRTITNGNTACIAVDVIPGVVTNMAIVQFK